jgi:hypothetical protein
MDFIFRVKAFACVEGILTIFLISGPLRIYSSKGRNLECLKPRYAWADGTEQRETDVVGSAIKPAAVSFVVA